MTAQLELLSGAIGAPTWAKANAPLGFRDTPPSSPWGVNFGGGLNSTALLIEARRRGLTPDWILFADTGSELPETLAHVETMRAWAAGWCDLTVVRWIRQDGSFESIHDNCLRTNFMPSKAYGYSGCTTKWKIQPMERWRKANGFDRGAYAVGYDAGERGRIQKACRRGDDPNMTAWYPLVAWGIDRDGCQQIVDSAGMKIGKSSCFMCPNMKKAEWRDLRNNYAPFWNIALEIDRRARAAGRLPQGGRDLGPLEEFVDSAPSTEHDDAMVSDRCIHGGCFT